MRSGGDARGELLVVGQLLVGGAGRVDDQALGVADVGEEAEQLDAVDEPPAGVRAALDAERDEAAEAARERRASRSRGRRATARPG